MWMFLPRLEQRITKPDAVARYSGTIISADFMTRCKQSERYRGFTTVNFTDAASPPLLSVTIFGDFASRSFGSSTKLQAAPKGIISYQPRRWGNGATNEHNHVASVDYTLCPSIQCLKQSSISWLSGTQPSPALWSPQITGGQHGGHRKSAIKRPFGHF